MDRTEERAQLLAQLLIWEGALKRSRILELHDGLSAVRASQWIREFRDKYPRWVKLDTVGRRYVPTEQAFTAWRKLSAGRDGDQGFASYLNQVGLSANYFSEQPGSALSAFPDFSTPSPAIFSQVRRAIDERKAVELTYRSLANPAPHQRIVEPHALVRAGRRWHVRAYCIENKGFRDYSLGRIAHAALLSDRPAAHGAEDDLAWSTAVEVVLVAHPALSPPQADVVRFEYFNGTAARRQSCRAALVGYLVQDLRAATDTASQQPPEFQLAVANVDALRAWLFPSAKPAPT